MIVASIAEMLLPQIPPARPSAEALVSDQSSQTFSESLLGASKASSGTNTASEDGTKAGRRQKAVPEDAKLPGTASHVVAVQSSHPSQQMVPQEILMSQQALLSNPALIAMHSVASPDPSTIAAGQPMREATEAGISKVESNKVLPTVLSSDTLLPGKAHPDSDLLRPSSVLPAIDLQSAKASVMPELQIGTDPSNTVVNAPSSAILSSPSNVVPNAAVNAAAGKLPNAIQDAFPGGSSNVVKAAVPSAVSKTAPDSDAKAIPGSVPKPVLNTPSDAVLPATSSAALNPDSIPAVHAGASTSAKQDTASKSSSNSTEEANSSVAVPDPGGFVTSLTVPGDTASQVIALFQPGGQLPVNGQPGASVLSSAAMAKPSATAAANGKDGANNALIGATDQKPNASSASDQASSQGMASSGDQSQSGTSQQGQSPAPVQISFANHPVAAIDHGQTTNIASPPLTPPTLAGTPGHSAKVPDTAAPASIVIPQALPVINTAKLIQSMGQSEMRVGIRSDDFGNISISTSATRDLISAQISLDHGELARTLAAHLPEMQARFGGNQAMDVRIDMNGQGASQGAGTSAGMSHGSGDESRGDRQQKGGTGSSHSVEGFAEQGRSLTTAAMLIGESRVDARLDLRA